jgi:predicted NBD/HSP70 family sugar kinase
MVDLVRAIEVELGASGNNGVGIPGVIVGTGRCSGVVVDGRVIEGRHRIAGKWSHTPLPWPSRDELPGPTCWCGRSNCLETLISGPGRAQDCDGPDARNATGIPPAPPPAMSGLAPHSAATPTAWPVAFLLSLTWSIPT